MTLAPCSKIIECKIARFVVQSSQQQARGNLERLDLEEHIGSRRKKQKYVNRLFETIAHRYDFFTAFMSYGMDRSWKETLVGRMDLNGTEKVLDLACGTGDIAFLTGNRLHAGLSVGLDITQNMLDIAERKRRDANAMNVTFHRGDIMQMPFADETFDFVTGGYALRNVPDIRQAVLEVKRLLRPGGWFFSLDFGHPTNRLYRWLYIRYLIVVGSIVGFAMHGDPDTYRYIPATLKLYPGQNGVREIMHDAGFASTDFMEFGGGIMAINYGRKP
jgi:demethylmenaquinone methyltransferase / 2-methoxy-6-polyprenyl-1,4-benzoquinol methylase